MSSSVPTPGPAEQITPWPIELLDEHPHNPRGLIRPDSPAVEELAASIKVDGVIEPLIVVPHEGGRARVIAGHRRRVASRVAGLTEVPVLVRDYDAHQQMRVMLVDNIQRHEMTPLEEARGFAAWIRQGASKAQAAREVGVAPEYVTARLAILDLEPTVQELFDARDMPAGAAVHLLDFRGERQIRLAIRVSQRKLSVEQLKLLKAQEPHLAEADSASRISAPPAATGVEGRRWARTRRRLLAASGEEGPRGAALAFLRDEPGRAVRLGEVAQAVVEYCDECGEHLTEVGRREICSRCPLPMTILQIKAHMDAK